MLTKSDKFNIISTLIQASNDLKVISSIFKTSNTYWDNFREANGEKHLIEDFKFSGAKTDSVKAYISAIIRMYLDSDGVTQNGYTKKSLEAHSDFIVNFGGQLSGIPRLTSEVAFKRVMVHVLGWDDRLVELGMKFAEMDDYAKFNGVLRYVIERYEMIQLPLPGPLTELTPNEIHEYNKEVEGLIELYTGQFTEAHATKFLLSPSDVGLALLEILIDNNLQDPIKILSALKAELELAVAKNS